ncbi:unnamed protein product [Ixodes hexagonus]
MATLSLRTLYNFPTDTFALTILKIAGSHTAASLPSHDAWKHSIIKTSGEPTPRNELHKGSPDEEITMILVSYARLFTPQEMQRAQKRQRPGIVSNVTLGGKLLTNWTMEAVPLTKPEQLSLLSSVLTSLKDNPKFEVPAAFFGGFVLPKDQKPLDTFLDPTGFGKGVAILNGFNLGRYWPSMGPQVTLYVPGILLFPYPKSNLLVLFEMEVAPEGAKTVKFVDVPNIDGPTSTLAK